MVETSPSSARAPGLPLAALLLLVSGAAALVHQTAWVRMFGQSVGTSHEAVATVLAAFFFGLGLGSLAAERWTRRQPVGLHAYAALEAGIGAGGLVLFWTLPRLNAVLARAPALGDVPALRFLLAFLLLALPAICMGATFPVLAAVFVRRRAELGSRLGALYSLNTLGAVSGALAGGFYLIPRFGLSGAVHTAVMLNVVAAAVAAGAAGRFGAQPDAAEEATAAEGGPEAARARRVALVALVATGFVALACEVAWTRVLGILTGTTLYGFSAILAAFLTGIALGAWAARARLARLKDPRAALAGGLVLLGATLLATRAGLAFLPALQGYAHDLHASPGARNLLRYGAAFLLLLPPTCVFGALYPLSLQLYCGDVAGVRARLGRAFAANTFASILGALATGFWLIPVLGTDRVLLALALLTLAASLVVGLPFTGVRGLRRVLAPALVLALAGPFLPGLRLEDVIRAVRYTRDSPATDGRFLYMEEGRGSVVSVVTYDGRAAELLSNGLKEALIDLENPRFGPPTEGLLGIWPYLLHPAPKSAFVVGFGGGTTVGTLAFTDLERIRVVELEPRVVDAVRQLHGGAVPCLADPRVELSFGDARSRLLLEGECYDLIVSQPSHPWLAGAGNLFTREFFELERSRLAPGGLCAQWVNLFRMERDVLCSVIGTFFAVFPEGFVCMNAVTGDVTLIGSEVRPVLRRSRFDRELAEHPDLERFLDLNGLHHAGDLLWFFYCGRDSALALAGDAPLNTDLNLFSEVRLAAVGGDPGAEANLGPLLARHYTLDPRPYLDPDSAAQTLHEAGRFFVEFEHYDQAQVMEGLLGAMGEEYRAGELRQAIMLSRAQGGAVQDSK